MPEIHKLGGVVHQAGSDGILQPEAESSIVRLHCSEKRIVVHFGNHQTILLGHKWLFRPQESLVCWIQVWMCQALVSIAQAKNMTTNSSTCLEKTILICSVVIQLLVSLQMILCTMPKKAGPVEYCLCEIMMAILGSKNEWERESWRQATISPKRWMIVLAIHVAGSPNKISGVGA